MQLNRLISLLLLALLVLSFANDGSAWRRRRRRRRRSCSPSNCQVNSWSSWSNCNAACGRAGSQRRYRSLSRAASCGGSCNVNNNADYRGCNGPCCRVNCAMNSWSGWSSCNGCGYSTQYRYRYVARNPSCGGYRCPSLRRLSRTCNTGRCCAVNCLVNNWGSWGSCSGSCSSVGYQYRQRSVGRQSQCGGSSCGSLVQRQRCRSSCCRTNCLVSNWSGWSTCSSSCGYGRRSRSRSVVRYASCGGSGCPSTSEFDSLPCFRYVNRDCIVNSWSSYGSCRPSNGRCGSGSQYRYRSVTVAKQCKGGSCPSLSQSRSCSAGCCPTNCLVGSWGSWGSCSAVCGTGLRYRSRSITARPSCGGAACPSTSEAKSCFQTQNVLCQVSGWSSWTACSNLCGKGTQTRSRRVTVAAKCGGSCPNLSEKQSCTSHASSRDCKVNAWGAYGSCSQSCGLGRQYRYRTVSQQPACNGNACPVLADSKTCGQANGGCQQYCSSGTCSCQTGYLLNSDKKTCRARSCGAPSVKYCPSGTTHGSTCNYPTFSCGGYTYQQTCNLQCTKGYEIRDGPSTIVCLSSGTWTPHGTAYCRRKNEPPTKISLSSTAVNENVAVGTVVGTLSTSDPNPSDSHVYALLATSNGKFTLSGNKVKISFSPDYETQSHQYSIKVRSSDPGGLYRDETLTISVRNVNEAPTSVSLSNSNVKENAAKGTAVGSLSTTDPESSQTHTYKMMDSAGGRFVLSGNVVQVAVSNARCLAEGGSQCQLNYESSKSHTITIRSTDSGKPALYKDFTLTIAVDDINDRPRNLQLSGYTLREDRPVGTVIGTLSCSDEDKGQKLTYTLSVNAGGRFGISKGNQVVRKSSSGIDYETAESYKITVVVKDSGKPALSLSYVFTIEVVNVNEAPVSIDFISTGGQLSFSDNKPLIKENSVKGTVVGTLVAYDADSVQTLTFKLDDTAGGRFVLSTKTVSCVPSTQTNIKTKCTVGVLVNGTLNHEQDALHTIVVRVTDQHGLFKTSKIPVTVINVNDRPTDITFSGNLLSVEENKNSALIGEFSTIDDDPAHTHKYTLVSSAGGRFVMSGSRLFTASNANLNYESTNQLSIVIRSTDSGTPPLHVDKSFTVKITDVNEAPTLVWLASSTVNENSPIGTTVGSLQTTDPDNKRQRQIQSPVQTHTYTLLESAQGRFKIENGVVKIAVSNTKCLAFGGAECKLNYEKWKTHRLLVRSTDSGSPPLQRDFNVTVFINDVNDKPRSLTIDAYQVKENSPKGTLVGQLSANEEDAGQKLTFSLTNSDKGRFYLKGNQLLKASLADYETAVKHVVTVKVTDNGNPLLSISKNFTIEVLDVNEAPATLVFKDTGSELTFTDNFPKVSENEALGTVVGTVEVHDEDKSQTLTFKLDDDDGGLFSISSSSAVVCSSSSKLTGVNTVCTAKIYVAGTLNHEDTDSHAIIVRATDKGGLFITTKFTITVLDVNDGPSDIQLASGNPQVRENDNSAVVGELITTDDDATQTHSYKLLDSAAGRFTIVGREVRVTAKANLDYEAATQYTIRVMSTDSGKPALSKTKSFTVKILDVNEKPISVHITSDLVKENSPLDTVVGSLTTSDPDNSHVVRQTFSYRIVDSANGRFKVDGSVVKVKVPNTPCLALGGKECYLNFEDQRQHQIIVRATDSGAPSLYVDYTLTIHIQDVNDQPRHLDLSHNEVFENDSNGTVVGNLSCLDEDAKQTITYSLSDDGNGMFKIVNNQLQKAKPTNYETSTAHSVVVLAKDNGSPSMKISKRFTIEVLNINEAPINISITDNDGQLPFTSSLPRVEENSPTGTVVGTVEALDYDANETLTFRLDDDSNSMFALGTSKCKSLKERKGINTFCWTTLVVNGPLNYEGQEKHYIELRVTDNEGLFHVQRFNIEIVDINDVPHDIELRGREEKENMNDAEVGQFTTEDQDPSHHHSYTLVDDASGAFVVKADKLFTSPTANLDYESKREYNITVRSTDNGTPPLFIEESYLITVLDQNEAPTLVTVSNSQVPENSPSETVVGVLSVSDPDNYGPAGVWQSHNCSAVDTANGRFTVDSNVVKVAVSTINYEANTTFSVVIRCVDSGNPQLYRDEPFVITVLDVNEIPTGLVMEGGVVKENSLPQTVATFYTSDPDNEFFQRQNFTYTLTVTPNGFPFVIDGNELKTTRSLNYEVQQSWQVTVRTTDSGGLFISETFQLNVTDVNDPPSGIAVAGTASVPENSPPGTFIGQLQSTDEDYRQTRSYGLVAVSPGRDIQNASAGLLDLFSLDAATGELSVGNKGLLDYEAVPEYTMQIVTTDSGTPSYSFTGTVLVIVTNVNEAPVNITLTGNTIDEGSPVNAVIGHLTVSDPDNENTITQSHHCVVLDPDHQPFKVMNNLSLVVAQATLNYEQEEFSYVGIRCFDDGNPQMYVERQFTIQVVDTNESPSQVGLTSYTISENEDPGSLIGITTGVDPDNEQDDVQNVTFVIEEGDTVPFAINGTDVVSTISFDFENQSMYVFHLTAIDDGVPPRNTTKRIEIHIIDVNDQPTFVGLDSSGIDENSPTGTVVGTLYSHDEDRFQSYVYSIILQEGIPGLFAVKNNQLIVASGTELNYEEEPEYTIVAMVTDNGTPPLSYERDVIVRVLDVNEHPSGIVSYTKDEIEEDSPAGTWVANLTVVDEDFNQTHQCRLLNGSQYFAIVAIDGVPEIRVSSGAVINYETEMDIWVNVECVDSGYPPLTIQSSFDVSVIDINDPITEIILTGSLTVREDVPVNTAICGVSAIDEDRGQTHTYVVVGETASGFKVDNSRRQLIVTRPVVLNFESLDEPYINVTISVTDDGIPPMSYNQTFTFTVENINEPPVIAINSLGIYENASSGDPVGKMMSNNPERDQIVTFRILDVDGVVNSTWFFLRETDNSTYLYLNVTVHYESQSSFALEIEVTDNGSPPASSQALVTVNVLRTDPCAIGTANCDENAVCHRQSANSSSCVCNVGYDGDGHSCSDIDECADTLRGTGLVSLCNFGNCTDEIANYSCTCVLGFTGFDCSIQINECLSNPCGRGKCTDDVNGYTCSCSDGYTGRNCEVNIDDCTSTLCGAGTCVDDVDDYTCQCPGDMIGDRCSFPVDVCKHPGVCKQSTCIPKSVNAPVVLKVDVGSDATGLPPVAIQPVVLTNGKFDDSDTNDGDDSPFVCVQDDDVVTIVFPPGLNASKDSFKNKWERYLEGNLYVTIPANDSGDITDYNVQISAVYITGSSDLSDGSTAVHFVVMVNDKAVGPYSVVKGLDSNCLNSTTLDDATHICSAVKKTLSHLNPPAPIDLDCLGSHCPNSGSVVGGKNNDTSVNDIIWPVVSSVLFLALIVAIALLYRSYRSKKRLEQIRATYSDESDFQNERQVDNPIYYDTAEDTEDPFEEQRLSGVSNPLFSPDDDDETGTPDNPMYDALIDVTHNPIYTDASTDMRNPIYQPSNSTEPVYDNPKELSNQ